MRQGHRAIGRLFTLFILAVLLLSLLSCKKAPIRTEFHLTGPFDTVSFVILITEDARQAEYFQSLIEEELWRYHRLYDIYHEYPGLVNLKTVNDRAGQAVTVAPEIMDLLAFGLDLCEKSEGRVNIAMGSVLQLWHEARMTANETAQNAYLPSFHDLEAASKHIDCDNVRLEHPEGTVTLLDPLMSLDVGAIAKGYAVEQLARTLEKEGLLSGVLDIGGNVRAIGKNEMTGKSWRVGIRHPDPDHEGLLDKVDIVGLSVVTSGSYERSFIFEGQTYSHIIDPSSLYPAAFHDAVTVIAPDSAVGDALSTALMLMSVEEGRQFLTLFPGCEALWVTGDTRDVSGGFSMYQAQAGR